MSEVVSIQPNEFILTDSDIGAGFLDDLRVTCRIFENHTVVLHKIEQFNERFQVYSDITIQALGKPEELEHLRYQISDWHIGYKHDDLNRRRHRRIEFNNDEPA